MLHVAFSERVVVVAGLECGGRAASPIPELHELLLLMSLYLFNVAASNYIVIGQLSSYSCVDSPTARLSPVRLFMQGSPDGLVHLIVFPVRELMGICFRPSEEQVEQ
jgi:hypothetical protein